MFRTIYRGSGWAFAHDPDFNHVSDDPKFWDALNEKFYTKYRQIDLLHQQWAQTVVRGQYIVGPTGREWFVPMAEDRYGNPKLPWSVFTNYPVQGTGADIVCVARISLANRLQKHGFQARLVSTVHDSIVADAPKSEVEPLARLMHDVFNDIPKNVKKIFKHELALPFPCEVKVGNNLLELTELKIAS